MNGEHAVHLRHKHQHRIPVTLVAASHWWREMEALPHCSLPEALPASSTGTRCIACY